MCKRYPGFLRLALQDPAPERKFYRRGWATFDRSVNIKEICWNLTNIRVSNCVYILHFLLVHETIHCQIPLGLVSAILEFLENEWRKYLGPQLLKLESGVQCVGDTPLSHASLL